MNSKAQNLWIFTSVKKSECHVCMIYLTDVSSNNTAFAIFVVLKCSVISLDVKTTVLLYVESDYQNPFHYRVLCYQS